MKDFGPVAYGFRDLLRSATRTIQFTSALQSKASANGGLTVPTLSTNQSDLASS